MKRLIALLLAFACMACFSGCSADTTLADSLNFYYCTSDISYQDADGVIAAETRQVEHNSDLINTLNLYLQGPAIEELRNPFPVDTKVESLRSDNETLYLTMSVPFGELSGLELTLACACLCRTALEITNLHTVQIRCPDVLLDGNPAITMNLDSLIWLDAAETLPAAGS